jgi:hypothetical protein
MQTATYGPCFGQYHEVVIHRPAMEEARNRHGRSAMKGTLEIALWLTCIVGGTLCVVLVVRAVVLSHEYKALVVLAVIALAVAEATGYLLQALRSRADSVKQDS